MKNDSKAQAEKKNVTWNENQNHQKKLTENKLKKQITRKKIKGDHTTVEDPNLKEEDPLSTTNIQNAIENQTT